MVKFRKTSLRSHALASTGGRAVDSSQMRPTPKGFVAVGRQGLPDWLKHLTPRVLCWLEQDAGDRLGTLGASLVERKRRIFRRIGDTPHGRQLLWWACHNGRLTKSYQQFRQRGQAYMCSRVLVAAVPDTHLRNLVCQYL